MDITQLLQLVKQKQTVDQQSEWCKGSSTYLEGIPEELEEVKAEIISGKQPHLEDELGDVLWDYLNALVNLEAEGKINIDNIPKRALKKYGERVNGILEGKNWNDIKKKQKEELDAELN